MKRSAPKRKTPLRARSNPRRRKRPRYADPDIAGHTRAEFYAAAKAQGECMVTHKRKDTPWQAHHVVYAQHVEKEGGAVWDPRNTLRVSTVVHRRHHDAISRIPLHCLTDDNVAFAFELLGDAAPGYLCRRYGGYDTRVGISFDTECAHADAE